MKIERNKHEKLGDEAPTGRDFLIIIVAVGMLILLSWIAWRKLGWFH